MASCTTSKWSTAAPQIRLTVTQASSTATTVTLNWKLEYIANSSNISTNGQGRSYSVTIDGSSVASGSYVIDRSKGTYTIRSGTKTVNKSTSSRNVSFKCSMNFDITWSGVYGGTKSASGSIAIGAKTSYTVTYNANGGSGAPGKQTKWAGTNITLSNTKPTRTGYTFQGWATSASSSTVSYKSGATYSSNASITLYAVWKANTYTISYNANGGTGAPSNQTKTYGQTLVLSTTKPTRTNYNFLGWATSASSSTATYQPGGSYTSNAQATLYAVWELAYVAPRITNFTVDRCISDGTLSEEGTYGLVEFDYECDKVSTGTHIEYKVSTDDVWISQDPVQVSALSGHVKQIIGTSSNQLSTELTYNVRITVEDELGSTILNKNIAPIVFDIDFLYGGKGVAIGKPASKQGFEIAMDSTFEKNVSISVGSKLKAFDTAALVDAAFLEFQSNGRPSIANHIGLKNGMWLQGELPSGAFANILRMNANGQVELNWTNSALKGRVWKSIWRGSFSSGSITVPELPYYNLFYFILNGASTVIPVYREIRNDKRYINLRGVSAQDYIAINGKKSFLMYGFSGTTNDGETGTVLTMVQSHSMSIYPDDSGNVRWGSTNALTIAEIIGVI